MKRNWTGIVGGYVLIALLGAMAVIVGTAFLRASVVHRELTRAERLVVRGRPGAALGHLDRVRKWSHRYPELERRRLLTTIRCHVQRLDIQRAVRAADSMLDVDVYDVGGALTSLVDSMPAEQVNMTVMRTPTDPLAAWDGYVCLIQELCRYHREDLVEPIIASLSARFPGGALPHPIHATLRTVGLTGAVQGVPPTQPPAGATPPDPDQQESVADGTSGTTVTAISNGPAAGPQTPPEPEITPPDSGRPTWAIAIRDEAPAYDLTGTLSRRVDVGTIIEVTDTRESSAGRVAVGRIVGATGPDIAVYVRDLETYNVPLTEVPRATRDLLVRRVQLQSTTEALRKRLTADAIAAANPYATDYRRTKDAYAAFYRKAKDAKEKMDASTGGEHMTYADQLRAMKTEEIPILKAFEDAKKAYEAWMTENEGSLDSASSPELQQLEAELARVERELTQQ